MYVLEYTGQFKTDLKAFKNDAVKKKAINKILIELRETGTVSDKYKPHPLKGNYKDNFECHILPDLLLIWQKKGKTIKLVRIGSHSKLFK